MINNFVKKQNLFVGSCAIYMYNNKQISLTLANNSLCSLDQTMTGQKTCRVVDKSQVIFLAGVDYQSLKPGFAATSWLQAF